MGKSQNRYEQIIERIFSENFAEGVEEVIFQREDIIRVAKKLRIKLPKNIGDLIYSFRYRAELPSAIARKAPKGKQWIIRPIGRASYAFEASALTTIAPNVAMSVTKVPDSTPGIIAKYSLSDEQALLAKLRYNRLIDIFTGITCYSLQNHLRTTVAEMGQVETDEIYVGLDKRGVHYVFPVQAKGGKDKLGIVQIEQDFAICAEKFPSLVCRSIAAQFMDDDVIALFEFEESRHGIAISSEKHYQLVPHNEMTQKDLEEYKKRTS